MLLIGSRALMFRAPGLLNREPLDFDFVAERDDAESWIEKNSNKLTGCQITRDDDKIIIDGSVKCEFEIASTRESTRMLLELGKLNGIVTSFGVVPMIDVLFALKKSHRFLKNSPHFWKTLIDYHAMKDSGCVVSDRLSEFFKVREKETYSYKHPNLKQSKKEFFNDDQISYIYDHDSIHQIVMLGDVPAYTLFKKDGEDVQCDRGKFNALSHDIKIASVVEEACVLAIERSLVPHPGVLGERRAWLLAVSKVMSSITSGWWREFAYEHAFDVLKAYPHGFWNRFQTAIERGLVKKHVNT